jgi:hypothetical protein
MALQWLVEMVRWVLYSTRGWRSVISMIYTDHESIRVNTLFNATNPNDWNLIIVMSHFLSMT